MTYFWQCRKSCVVMCFGSLFVWTAINPWSYPLKLCWWLGADDPWPDAAAACWCCYDAPFCRHTIGFIGIDMCRCQPAPNHISILNFAMASWQLSALELLYWRPKMKFVEAMLYVVQWTLQRFAVYPLVYPSNRFDVWVEITLRRWDGIKNCV